MLISEIYNKKPITVSFNAKIADIVEILAKVDGNAAIVLDDKNHVVGVVSIQDIAEAIVPQEFEENVEMAVAMYTKGFFHRLCSELKDRPVSDIMHTDFLKADLGTNILAVMADLLKNHLYIVPVIQDEVLIGVVTRTEIKKALYEGLVRVE